MIARLVVLVLIASSVLLPRPARADGCTWITGSDDGIANTLYPDENAEYWVAALPPQPPGFSYRIVGQFPRARFISFNVYNGAPADHIFDAQIRPDRGSANPFIAHARRDVRKRSYTIPLVNAPPPAAHRTPGVLYIGGGQLGTPNAVPYFVYRIYVPDKGTGRTGGVAVPRIEILDPAGDVLTRDFDAAPCEPTRRSVTDTLGATLADAERSGHPPVLPVTRAADPPAWGVSTGLTDAYYSRVTGSKTPVRGGPASNEDNTYVSATIGRSLGEVFAMRAKAPREPKTYGGEKTMGAGDLRYWSFCQNDRALRFVACLKDEDIVADRDGYFVLAVSGVRPRNARNWLPWGASPEGVVIYRQMLPSRAFYPRSIRYASDHDAVEGAPLAKVMGPYLPKAKYCSTAQFERNRCGF